MLNASHAGSLFVDAEIVSRQRLKPGVTFVTSQWWCLSDCTPCRMPAGFGEMVGIKFFCAKPLRTAVGRRMGTL